MTLPPLTDADWPAELADLRAGFMGKGNVYRTMAHHPALITAWTGLRAHLVTGNALGPARSEVVILRIGHGLGAAYEWAHHVVRARAAGLDDARIATLQGPVAEMAPEDAVLCSAVDALVAKARLSSQIQSDVTDLIDKQGMLDLMALVGMYSTLAYIVNSFDTPIDDDILAELSARPFRP